MATAREPMPPAPDASGRSQLSSWYTQGPSDGLGDRLLMFDNAATGPLELLRVRPDFAFLPDFESRLRARLERLSSFSHPGFALARSVNHLDDGEGLTVVSAHVAGTRLSELFPHGRPHAGMHPTLARWIVGELTSALAALHWQGRDVAHGLLAPERIVIAPDRHVIVTDYLFADALSAMHLPAERLWTEFGIVPAPGTDLGTLGQRGDVVQLALVCLSLVLGRRVTPDECGRQRLRLLDEFTSVCDRQSPGTGRSLRSWVEQALDRDGFRTAADADAALVRLTGPSQLDARTSAADAGPGTLATATAAGTARAGTAERPQPSHAALLVASTTADEESIDAAPRQRFRIIQWMAGGLAVIGIVQGAIIAGLVFRPAAPSPSAPASAVTTAPAPAVAPAPRAAQGALPEGTDTGAPAAARAPQTGAVIASSTTASDPTAVDGTGRLRIASGVPLQVSEAGRTLGSSGGRPLSLSPGSHTLELASDAFGFRTRETVRVVAGRETELTIALPNGTVHVNAQPWAQVSIDGAAVGDTPLANLSLVIGDHEVVFRHPQLGERRQRVVVKAGALTRVSATFGP